MLYECEHVGTLELVSFQKPGLYAAQTEQGVELVVTVKPYLLLDRNLIQ